MCDAAEVQLAGAIVAEAAAAAAAPQAAAEAALAPAWGAPGAKFGPGFGAPAGGHPVAGSGAVGFAAPGGAWGAGGQDGAADPDHLLPEAPGRAELAATAASFQTLLISGRHGEALRYPLKSLSLTIEYSHHSFICGKAPVGDCTRPFRMQPFAGADVVCKRSESLLCALLTQWPILLVRCKMHCELRM